MKAELASILLVEDDPGDVMLIRDALAEHKVGNTLSIDLNLPRKSGAEVLADIKGDPELSTIPVVVLTTSKSEDDVLRSYQHHANAFITKPLDFEHFKDIVRQIDDFFIGIVKLPPRGASADGA